MRWLFHVAEEDEVAWGNDGRYAPTSLAKEGFVHASFKDAVLESARLYFEPGARLKVLAIDPRRLDVEVTLAHTPRGPMPHVLGSIPDDAIRILDLDKVADHPDEALGAKIGFAAFEGMTLLDLVGPLDALSRIASMHFDLATRCEVFALTRPPDETTALDIPVWSACGMEVRTARYRPDLDQYDVLVVPGGPGTRELVDDRILRAYLGTFPHNRLVASVCTGSLLLGAAGRLDGRRATTHHRYYEDLARWGAVVVEERVVDVGQIVTAGGVTSGIDLGLHLVERLMGEETRDAIAKQMEAS
jgi:cyclohexyl-isocyanide hydratase